MREFARRRGVSPTYLSKVERGGLPPSTEERVKETAQLLGEDIDELLALAGRISSDLEAIIKSKPRLIVDFLRQAQRMPEWRWPELTEFMRKKPK